MQTILGINNNTLSGACLVKNGEIVAAANEERFNNTKDYRGWPTKSIEFCLDWGGVNLIDLDKIAYGWSAGFDAENTLELYLDRYGEARADGLLSELIMKERIRSELENDSPIRQEMQDWIFKNGLKERLVLVDHHRCHALGAFVVSPYDKAIVITSDGRGDFQSMTVTAIIDGRETVVHRQTTMDSLGYYFGRITKSMGFVPNRHEGKVTGLAAHGKSGPALALMREMIWHENGRLRSRLSNVYAPFYDRFDDGLTASLADFSREDIAWAAQRHLETTLQQMVEFYLIKYPFGNVCLSGGTFANVRVNQIIAEMDGVVSLFVLPCMGDGGLALQAAVSALYLTSGTRAKLPSMFLGPMPDVALGIASASSSRHENIKFERLDKDTCSQRIVEALVNGEVVGLFRGRAEFGPRALGNRSLLCRPDIPNISETLNQRLSRSDFMPFAPILCSSRADACLLDWSDTDHCTPFMTRTFDCKKELLENSPSIVHCDGSARPQVLLREADPFLYDVLDEIGRQTGLLCLINTSFNVHESPIVGSLQLAINGLTSGVCDVLFADDCIELRRLT